MSNELSKARDFAQMIETDNPATRLSKRSCGPGTCDVTNALLCVTFRDMGDIRDCEDDGDVEKMHNACIQYCCTHFPLLYARAMGWDGWDVVQLYINSEDCDHSRSFGELKSTLSWFLHDFELYRMLARPRIKYWRHLLYHV